MLGRKTYTQEGLDHAKAAVAQQLAAYRKLVKAIDGTTSDPKVTSALEAFEPLLVNNNDAVLRGNNVIKLVPDQSVMKLKIGDRIRLSAAQFEPFIAPIVTREYGVPTTAADQPTS